MNEGIRGLFSSLVGSSIEYRFESKFVSSAESSISATKKKIEEDVELALMWGHSALCVMLLAELTYHYSKQPYYMAVRSSIELRRFRPSVLEYMRLSVEERAERLKKVLQKVGRAKERELKIAALRYFLMTYPGRIAEFKELLTREEFLIVS